MLQPAVSLPVKPSKHLELYSALLTTKEQFRDISAQCPDVISSKGFSAAVPKHLVRHSVPTTPGPPVFAKARRLDTEKLESTRTKFLLWERQVLIIAQTLLGSAPLHMVQKPDGSWCPCSDYCCLNTMTVPDRYPLPNMANFTSCLNC